VNAAVFIVSVRVKQAHAYLRSVWTYAGEAICTGKFLKGSQANDASFYGPGKLRRLSVAFFLFSFPSMALPLDPLAHSVRVQGLR
jgi:hypothetical protein